MIDAHGDPGTPDARGGGRYLWWLVTRQPGRAAAGAVLGTVWMVLLAAAPYLMSRAVDDGLQRGDQAALAGWSAALLAVGACNAGVGLIRHRVMTQVRMDANFRTVKVVVGQAVRLGVALSRQVGTGEVVTIGVGDVQTISSSLTVVGPGVGAVVAYLVVAGLLLSISPLLAALVLLGVPVLAVVVGPLLNRLQGVETEYRERQGLLTARIGDLAGGLRVLGGLGGKGLFADAFRADSGRLREQGYRVGAVTSWVQALGLGLPTLFLAAVTWPAARLAAQGSITVGELVSVYGYVAVLVAPVAFFLECGYQVSRGLVAARRVVAFLRLAPLPDTGTAPPPAGPAELYDPDSGVRVVPGLLTALAGARPSDTAAVVDRLGRCTESAVTWGGVRLDAVPAARVRERILVADNEADLFAGPLRELIGGPGEGASEGASRAGALARAVHAAAAEDVVRGLPRGLDTPVDAQGRNLSGGQRQRVRLARALLADPEVLLAVEPTSALDAHTEAVVAARLRAVRTGRTTLLVTGSPLLLERADTVYHLVDGKVAAHGPHDRLLAEEPGYRALVSRDEEAAGPDEPDGRAEPDGHDEPGGRDGPAGPARDSRDSGDSGDSGDSRDAREAVR
ncbi:ABC-type multidrug transport system fused ATPase/permease subunit [Streptomyces sp. B3I7]|uniref:ABC transporter transmembrane domain-containing protein n=1 Tax=Streptomyces sp. B3I7 TaxID=3042269 RepID=UPI00277F0ADD|nr:ABC transporter ATP-binding protein [Streptomyces sp. B3I7]MDQ0811080.1 ABC-type multidrug transport system fused ATPase/permease subunit [Streptomyces sp. B3I7]